MTAPIRSMPAVEFVAIAVICACALPYVLSVVITLLELARSQ